RVAREGLESGPQLEAGNAIGPHVDGVDRRIGIAVGIGKRSCRKGDARLLQHELGGWRAKGGTRGLGSTTQRLRLINDARTGIFVATDKGDIRRGISA